MFCDKFYSAQPRLVILPHNVQWFSLFFSNYNVHKFCAMDGEKTRPTQQ